MRHEFDHSDRLLKKIVAPALEAFRLQMRERAHRHDRYTVCFRSFAQQRDELHTVHVPIFQSYANGYLLIAFNLRRIADYCLSHPSVHTDNARYTYFPTAIMSLWKLGKFMPVLAPNHNGKFLIRVSAIQI